MGKTKARVTIKDVAKLSGVSIATVSHVINDSNLVKEETKAKVTKAMKLLNFSPDMNARSLRQRRTKIIGMIVSDVSNQFFGQLSKAIEAALNANGYSLLLANSDGSLEKEKELVGILMNRRIDGLILIPAGNESIHLGDFVKNEIPMVLIDRTIPGLPVDAICVNNEEATALITDKLIAAGHRRIGVISGRLSSTVSAERIKGYLDSLQKNNILSDEALIHPGEFDLETGYVATKKLLELENPPSAIFAFNNLIGIGVIQALLEKGKYQQIEVAVWDDAPWQKIITPPLFAVVRQPMEQLGYAAVDALLKQVEGNDQNQVEKKERRIELEVTIEWRNCIGS